MDLITVHCTRGFLLLFLILWELRKIRFEQVDTQLLPLLFQDLPPMLLPVCFLNNPSVPLCVVSQCRAAAGAW